MKNNKTPVKKQDVKLPKNNTLHFQIGLVISLVSVYTIFQLTIAVVAPQQETSKTILDEDLTYVMNDFTIEKETKEEVKQKPEKRQLPTDPKVVDNDDTTEGKKEFLNEPKPSSGENVDPGNIDFKKDIIDVGPIPLPNVEVVPVFPGCETLKSNEERKNCLSEKIGKIIQRKFNTTLASDYGLNGIQKIDVQFKVDKKGNVSDIKVRAPHKVLEKEARRVINLIPQMKPGMHKNQEGVVQEVEVIFLKPIIFKVQ